MSQQETEFGNREIEWDSKIAYQTGVFYNRRLDNSLLSFQFEADYKKVGTSFFINDGAQGANPSSEAIYEFEYLGTLILPRIDLLPDERLNPNFMFGGIMDIRTGSKLILLSDSGNDSSLTQDGFIGGDLDQRTNKILFGYVMAGGIEIYTEPVIITIEGRYTSLFTKVFNESVEELPLNGETYLLKVMEDSRSNYFSFLLGFNFYF
jgi:hypothetical protein